MKLAEFDLDIQHREERNSANVDGITRTPPTPKRHIRQNTHRQLVRLTQNKKGDNSRRDKVKEKRNEGGRRERKRK